MGISDININSLSVSDFIYHASSEGDIFGYQPYGSVYYEKRYENEAYAIKQIYADHTRGFSDLGNGFYLGNDRAEAYGWGARFDDSIPVLNIFDLSDVNGKGRVLDIFSNYDDLMQWVVSTSLPRPKDSNINYNFSKLMELYPFNLDDYDWVMAPRSDDSIWSYTQMFLRDDLTTEGLLTCTDALSGGYQLVLKNDKVIKQVRFVEYEPYAIGEYPQLYTDGLRNEYFHYLDLVGNDIYVPSLNPSSESISDIIGIEKFVLGSDEYYG